MSDIAELMDSLKRVPKILTNFVNSIPRDKLDLRRGDGFWTIAEHVSHLAQVQPMLFERLERFVTEDHPEFIPYIPGDGDDEPQTPARMDMDAALDQFTQIRTKQMVLLWDADDVIWKKTAIHPEYDNYSFYILVRHILMHDHWHMYRMEELWLTKDLFLTVLQ